MQDGVTMLVSPLPGVRMVEDDRDKWEDGSVIGFRKEGAEALFVSWNTEEGQERGMVWIPIGEFSPDPEAVRPPDIEPEQEPPEQEDGTTERPGSPFGGRVRRRPGLEKE